MDEHKKRAQLSDDFVFCKAREFHVVCTSPSRYANADLLAFARAVIAADRATAHVSVAEPVGKIIGSDPILGWHMHALVPWEEIGAETLLYATQPAADNAPQAPSAGSVAVDFPYQKTFNAIAAATSVCGGHVAISVIDFREAYNAAPPANAQAPSMLDEKPLALFQFDERWGTWAQVDPNYAADPDVVPLYRHPSAAMGALRKLAEAAQTHFAGGAAPLRSALDEARALLQANGAKS